MKNIIITLLFVLTFLIILVSCSSTENNADFITTNIDSLYSTTYETEISKSIFESTSIGSTYNESFCIDTTCEIINNQNETMNVSEIENQNIHLSFDIAGTTYSYFVKEDYPESIKGRYITSMDVDLDGNNTTIEAYNVCDIPNDYFILIKILDNYYIAYPDNEYEKEVTLSELINDLDILSYFDYAIIDTNSFISNLTVSEAREIIESYLQNLKLSSPLKHGSAYTTSFNESGLYQTYKVCLINEDGYNKYLISIESKDGKRNVAKCHFVLTTQSSAEIKEIMNSIASVYCDIHPEIICNEPGMENKELIYRITLKYFGKYGYGYVAVIGPLMQSFAEHTETVGGFNFTHPTLEPEFVIYQEDGEICTLYEAYTNGILNSDNLKTLYADFIARKFIRY